MGLQMIDQVPMELLKGAQLESMALGLLQCMAEQKTDFRTTPMGNVLKH